MTEKDNNFVQELRETKNHSEWLNVVRLGLPSLLKNQSLLIAIISEEVKCMPDYGSDSELSEALDILKELGLHFEIT